MALQLHKHQPEACHARLTQRLEHAGLHLQQKLPAKRLQRLVKTHPRGRRTSAWLHTRQQQSKSEALFVQTAMACTSYTARAERWKQLQTKPTNQQTGAYGWYSCLTEHACEMRCTSCNKPKTIQHCHLADNNKQTNKTSKVQYKQTSQGQHPSGGPHTVRNPTKKQTTEQQQAYMFMP